MHFAFRYLRSEGGGSLRIQHTKVAQAAKADATGAGYAFTFDEPSFHVVFSNNDGQEATPFRGRHSFLRVFTKIDWAVGKFCLFHGHTVQQRPAIGVFLCKTPFGGTQYHSRSLKGDFGQHVSKLGEWEVSIPQPHRSPVEVIGVIVISRTLELHHMLLFTGEQLHLNFIHVYLKGGQSIF